jgi:hypothetical protein
VEHGSESGVLNFIHHSQTVLVLGGVTYSQAIVVILFFLDTVLVLFCMNLWQCFCGNRSLLWFIYLVTNGNMAVSCDHHFMIEKLLQNPFSSLSYDDKLKLIEEWAPKPNLNLYTKIRTCTQHFNTNLIVGLCILLRVYPPILWLKPPCATNIYSCSILLCTTTTCFGPDRWPSSGKMCTKIYLKVTTAYVNGSVESSIWRQVP